MTNTTWDRLSGVIDQFVESSDARLRGNAVHALAALVAADDFAVAEPADQKLAKTLGSISEQRNLDWQRRFTERAVDALKSLSAARLTSLAQRLAKQLGESRDRAASQALGRLLAAMVKTGLFTWRPNWLQLRRYTDALSKSSFWAVLLQLAWRFGLLAIGIITLWALTGLGSTDHSYAVISVFLISSVALSILTRISIVPQPWSARHAVAIDIVLAGLFYALIGMLGAWAYEAVRALGVDPTSVNQALLENGILWSGLAGFVAGVVSRGLRWAGATWRIAPVSFDAFWRAAFLLGLITLCAGVAQSFGANGYFVRLLWLVLASSTLVGGLVDSSLEERSIITSPSVSKSKSRSNALLPIATIVVFVLSGSLLWHRTEAKISEPLAKGPIHFAATDPGGSRKTAPLPTVKLSVGRAGIYRIAAQSTSSADIVLHLIGPSENFRQDDPELIEEWLAPGVYTICVVSFREDAAAQAVIPVPWENAELPQGKTLAYPESICKPAVSAPSAPSEASRLAKAAATLTAPHASQVITRSSDISVEFVRPQPSQSVE